MKKFPSGKINVSKNVLFFLLWAPTHHSFTYNLRFLYELKHKVRLSKNICGIFHFRFRFVFMKVYIFVQQNAWALTLKRYNSFQTQNNGNATHSFDPRPLIFKLQQEVLKFNDICVSWSSQKTDLVTNFLNPENRSFENVSVVFFKLIFYIPLFNNLFISLTELKNIH